jgi:hypothetical protein
MVGQRIRKVQNPTHHNLRYGCSEHADRRQGIPLVQTRHSDEVQDDADTVDGAGLQSADRELVMRREKPYKASSYIMAMTVSYVRVTEGSNTRTTSRRIHQIRPAARE